MLLNIALSFALLQQNPITIPAGYYTLGELGASLAKQHVPVVVAPACDHDVYALRLADTDWNKVMAALQRDERLVISKHGDSWQIERSDTVKRDETRSRSRYVAYAQNTTHSFFSGIAKRCAELELRTPEERHAAVEAARAEAGSDVAKQDEAQLLYLFSDEHDFPFLTLTVPAQLSDPAGQGFDKVVMTNLLEARFLISPDGDLSKFPFAPKNLLTPDDRDRWAKSVQIGLKLVWDPVRLAMGFRTAFFQTELLGNEGGTTVSADETVPHRFRLSIPATSVWSAAEIDAAADRTKHTAALLGTPAMTASWTGPDRTARASEALLRSAEASKTNLISYVSPVTDYVLPSSGTRSMAQAITDVNQDHVDAEALTLEVMERTGLRRGELKQSLKPASMLTASVQDDIVVVRNEARLLDGLCDVKLALPTSFANALYQRKRPAFSDLARSIAQLGPPQFFSSSELDFCNPVSFYPFASAISASPAFRKMISGLDLNVRTSTLLSKLDSYARNALLNGIGKCAPLNNATENINDDPMLAPRVIEKVGIEPLSIQVTRSDSSYTFAVLSGSSRIWVSWVTNVETAN